MQRSQRSEDEPCSKNVARGQSSVVCSKAGANNAHGRNEKATVTLHHACGDCLAGARVSRERQSIGQLCWPYLETFDQLLPIKFSRRMPDRRIGLPAFPFVAELRPLRWPCGLRKMRMLAYSPYPLLLTLICSKKGREHPDCAESSAQKESIQAPRAGGISSR